MPQNYKKTFTQKRDKRIDNGSNRIYLLIDIKERGSILQEIPFLIAFLPSSICISSKIYVSLFNHLDSRLIRRPSSAYNATIVALQADNGRIAERRAK